MSQMKLKGSFKYNGADLALMKQLAMTQDSHKAVEQFIKTALDMLEDPNELLEKIKKGEHTYANGR